MWQNIKSKTIYHWLLALILLAAFLIRTLNLNYNSPFLDEAIYINLGKIFWKGHWSELFGDISWVGGFPFFYPPLSAMVHALGGIIASRFFNVVLGVGSVFLIYRFTREIFPVSSEKESRTAGLVASALMATSTIPVTFSRLSKYDPLLLLITLYLAAKTKSGEAIGGILKSFWVPLLLLAIIYIATTFPELKQFLSVKTSEDHDSALTIVRLFLKYSPVVFLASIPAFYLMIVKSGN